MYDSTMNAMGMRQKMNNAINQVNSNESAQGGAVANSPVPAKNKGAEIYKTHKEKGATSSEMGNATTALWMNGRTQIALSLMAQRCKEDANKSDDLLNLGNSSPMEKFNKQMMKQLGLSKNILRMPGTKPSIIRGQLASAMP